MTRCGIGRSWQVTVMEFEFRVAGVLPPSVLAELGGVRVVTQSLETLLQGPVPDQAALIGIINRLQGLGVELHGVRQLDTSSTPRPLPDVPTSGR